MGKIELKIEVDADLFETAQRAGVSLDAAMESGLRQALRDEHAETGIVAAAARQALDPEGAERRSRKWAEDNAEAIAEFNQRVAEQGVFGAEWRRW
jgi:antitoxin CcdA